MCSITGGDVEQKVRADLKLVFISEIAFKDIILPTLWAPEDKKKKKILYKRTNDFMTLIIQLLRKCPYELLRKTKDIVIKKAFWNSA